MTGLFRGGEFYLHPSLTSYKNQIVFGAYDPLTAWPTPNVAVSGSGDASQPASGYQTLAASGETGDSKSFTWGVFYPGPTGSGSCMLHGIISFKIEVVEERGALTGSVNMTQLVGDRTGGGSGIPVETANSLIAQVVNDPLNGGRPF